MKSPSIGLIALALVPVASIAAAQDAFYKDKQVEVVVGFSPGGGTDLFGRAIAEGLAKHIEGKPTVIVRNMPGAGSVIASNYFVEQAPRDGTVILVGTGQLLMRMMLGLEGSKAKLADLDPIVATPMGRITYGAPVGDLNQAKAILSSGSELILGVPDVFSTIDAVLGLKVLEVKFTAIPGYKGKSETRLAFERGEVNVDEQTTPVYIKNVQSMVDEKKAVPLFAQGLMRGGNLVEDPAAPEIPTVADVYRDMYGKDPAGSAWDAYKAAITAIGNGGKILMLHADVPADARSAIDKAVQAMLADEEYLKAAASVLEGYAFNYGDALRSDIAVVSQMKPETVEWLKNFLKSDFGMTFE